MQTAPIHTPARPLARALAGLATALTLCAIASPGAWAQAYPSKPIKIVVPFVAGGATDSLARLIAEKMAPRLGQPVIVDNKAGAAGIVGTDLVAKSAPDGHTVVLGLSNSMLTNQFLFNKLPYNAQRDLVLVSQIAVAPLVLVVHPSVPASNGAELVAYVTQNKGKLSYGSYGQGSYPHLAGNFMSASLNADMAHAAYKGEAAMVQDLLGGQIQMAYASAAVVKPHIDAGKLKAIGVSGRTRMSTLPGMPTLAEQGLKDEVYQATGWLAMAMPAQTPPAVVQRFASELSATCALPEVRQRIGAMGFETVCSSPEAFAALYKQELPVWEHIIKLSGVKLD